MITRRHASRVTNSLEDSLFPKFFLANTPSLCSWLGFSNQWAIGRETWTRNSWPGAKQIEIYRGLATLHRFLITIIYLSQSFLPPLQSRLLQLLEDLELGVSPKLKCVREGWRVCGWSFLSFDAPSIITVLFVSDVFAIPCPSGLKVAIL